MWHGEILNLHVADLERFTGDELPYVERSFHPKPQLVRGQAVAVNRHIQFLAERLEALRVVGVFVGEEDAIEGLG